MYKYIYHINLFSVNLKSNPNMFSIFHMRKELREVKNLPKVTQLLSSELGLEDGSVKLQSVPCH